MTGSVNASDYSRLNGTLINNTGDNSQIIDVSTLQDQGFEEAGFSWWTAYAPCCEQGPNYDPFADTYDCMYLDACSRPGFFTAEVVG